MDFTRVLKENDWDKHKGYESSYGNTKSVRDLSVFKKDNFVLFVKKVKGGEWIVELQKEKDEHFNRIEKHFSVEDTSEISEAIKTCISFVNT